MIGSKKDASPIELVLKRLVKKLTGKEALTEEDIVAAWAAAAGEQAAGHSRPVSFRRARLTVNVDGSSWLYELTTKKRDLVGALQPGLKGRRLKDIRFRIGEITKGGK